MLQVVGLVRVDKNIVVATSDRGLHCYTYKGKRLWSLETAVPIVCLEVIEVRTLNLRMVAVALTDKRVQVYRVSSS